MIAGIILSLVVVAMPIIAGIVYARARAACAHPPVTIRAYPPPAPPSTPLQPPPLPEPDEWDALMADVRRAVGRGEIRL